MSSIMEREASEQEGSPLRAEDNLRSTKKVRIRPEEGRSETESQHETSDIQMSEKVPAGGEVPCIEFSNAIRDLLAKGMERCLVIKLLGRSINYHDLASRTQALWKLRGSYQLVDMERSFYFATFDLEEDYMKVLTGGPWMIYGAYLTVQPWSLEFDAKTSSISKVVAWVRIPGLSFRYYHKSTLRAIGSLLGDVVKIDYMTESRGRGKYARIAVLIGLLNPLIPRIKVDGKFYGIEYEGLPHICFTCGKYGHSRDRCPTMTPIDRPEVSQGKEPSQGHSVTEVHGMEVANSATGDGVDVNSSREDLVAPSTQENHKIPEAVAAISKQVPSNAFSNQGTMGYKKQLNGASENIRRNPIGTKSGSAQQKLEYRPKTLVVEKASQMQDKAAKASQRQNEGMEAAGFSGVESVVRISSTLEEGKHTVMMLQQCRQALEEIKPPVSNRGKDSTISLASPGDGGRDKENSPSGDLQRRPGANGVKLKSSGLRNLKVRKKAPGIQISKDALGVIREELDSLKDPSMPKKCMGDLAPSQEQVKN
ncbi:hypothetical protein K1719_004231 [Acacia pycnantha]|nr:hypothetical protein K1719_004231 [Acacia pycnantha]